jgi:hypothetical protein
VPYPASASIAITELIIPGARTEIEVMTQK